MKKGVLFLTVVIIAAMLLAGCGLSEAPSPTPSQTTPETTPTPGETPPASTPTPVPPTQSTGSGQPTGIIRVFVTDAPGYTIEHVWVNFSAISFHKVDGSEGEKGWITLDETLPEGTFETGQIDLAELSDPGDTILLAESEIAAGKYTQIRLIMNEEEGVTVTYIDPDGIWHEEVPAKLPSGILKFVRPFEVPESGETQILLDFDLAKSVAFTGSTQSEDVKVIVKPVVKLEIQTGELTIQLTECDEPYEIIESDISPEDEVRVLVTYNGDPVNGATVNVEGIEGSMTTDEDGLTDCFEVPDSVGDELNIEAVSGDLDGEREIDLVE